MAKVLPDFDFGRLKHGRGGAYDEFLDGQTWELTLEDAPSTTNIRVMQTAIAGAARRKGLKVQTQVVMEYDEDNDPVEDGAVLIVRAYKLDPDDPSGETEIPPEDWDN